VTSTLPLVAVVGLTFEERIIAAPGIIVVRGGDGSRLDAALEQALAGGASGLVSFGIAGGLSPGAPSGSVALATDVVHCEERYATDAAWRARVLAKLPGAISGAFAGVAAPATTPAAKAELHAATGAILVDMESHKVARAAAQRGIPFIAIRAVSDPAERALPPSALVGMTPDGETNAGAVMRSLARRPQDLPGLVRAGLDVKKATAALLRSRQLLGPLLGFLDRG
jgi:hopanoid-associated phosphorylase